jgi:uncharacterized protein YjbJ (UPF0337 family)
VSLIQERHASGLLSLKADSLILMRSVAGGQRGVTGAHWRAGARGLRRASTHFTKRGAAMNADVLKGKWHQLKGEVKSQWGQLTDDDLNRVAGDAEKLVGKVQERYGYERDRAKREVDNFITRHPDVK